MKKTLSAIFKVIIILSFISVFVIQTMHMEEGISLWYLTIPVFTMILSILTIDNIK
jgi:hypothetical protein